MMMIMTMKTMIITLISCQVPKHGQPVGPPEHDKIREADRVWNVVDLPRYSSMDSQLVPPGARHDRVASLGLEYGDEEMAVTHPY
jgi:hypothetical protein